MPKQLLTLQSLATSRASPSFGHSEFPSQIFSLCSWPLSAGLAGPKGTRPGRVMQDTQAGSAAGGGLLSLDLQPFRLPSSWSGGRCMEGRTGP